MSYTPVASSAMGQILHLAPTTCILTHLLYAAPFPTPHPLLPQPVTPVCPLHLSSLPQPLQSFSAQLPTLSPIQPCPPPPPAALELLLLQQHPSSPDWPGPAIASPRQGQARVPWDQLSAAQGLLRRGSKLGGCWGQRQLGWSQGCCSRWWCLLPPVRCGEAGGTAALRRCPRPGGDCVGSPSPGRSCPARGAAAPAPRAAPAGAAALAACGRGQQRPTHGAGHAGPRSPGGGRTGDGPCCCSRTPKCPCRDRLERSLPVRGLAWTQRQPRRLYTHTPRHRAGTRLPCRRTVPAHAALAPAHTRTGRGLWLPTRAHRRAHTPLCHAPCRGAGTGAPALPHVSRPRARLPPHFACPTALARGQRPDAPRRQPAPPR